jgi:uncharacterized protein YbjQ (UPF0145 family)/DNA-directed RNA polymerase subunit RPC12/RpoP
MPLRKCPECAGENFYSDGQKIIECKHCSSVLMVKDGELSISDTPLPEMDEQIEAAKETGDWSEVSPLAIKQAAADIILTTSFFVANREIENEIEVITAECVFGMNLFKDFFAGVRDVFGGRSAATQKVLRDARETALTELRREALMSGGDAVIGIDLDYQELSGGGKSGMLMIVASGTVVRLKR